MRFARSILAPAAVLCVAVLTGGWFLQQGVDQERNLYMQVRLLQEVAEHIAERYVEEVDRNQLYDAAIQGMVQDLDDPNTTFLDTSDYENLRIRTEGDYGGVGLEIVERDDWITVVTPLPGGPGIRAGIRAGDQIVEVEGTSTEGWSSDQAVERLRGAPGTEVDIGIRRPGVETAIPFTLTRARIELHAVPFVEMLEDGIGYVPLQMFRESASEEIRAAVDSLRGQGMTGLILDLRGNPGGLLDQGVAISDLFLEPGDAVVETRGRAPGQDETYSASTAEVFEGLPVVVLVDEFSASASEIVAGALQDHDRALLIGATSYGKGSVQTLYRLSGGNVLKLTTARWYTPSGRSIQKEIEDQRTLPDRAALALSGQLAERPDTADRPTFQTAGGRTVYGGGGITPDLIVMPDTLTSEEQRAVRAIYRSAGAFNTALFNYAVRYLQQNPDLAPDFDLSPADLDAFHRALPELEVEVDREVFEDASRFIEYQLEREIALQEWGTAGEFRSTLPSDPQVRRALELLREARTPDGLFAAAAVAPAGPGERSETEGTPPR